MNFGEQVALVTAAATGIGEATARTLASRGAKVILGDIDDRAGETVAESIRASGGEATYVHADVTRDEDIDGLIARALSEYGRLDLAVNNAGLGHAKLPMHQLDNPSWDRTIAVCLTAMFKAMRAELAHFIEAGQGSIVNLSSINGSRPGPGLSAYVASKHGVEGLTKQAAYEYVDKNIRVNAVAPGAIATLGMTTLPPAVLNHYVENQPTGRLGTPQEVADLITWLLSDEASFVTGSIHTVDGGNLVMP